MSADTPVLGPITNALGLTSPDVQRVDQSGINAQVARLLGIQSGAVETPLMSQYQQAANQAMGNTLAGMAQAKGARPSAQATMADITGSRMQGQAAEGMKIAGLQQQQQVGNMLGSLLIGQAGLSQNENMANLQSSNAAAGRLNSLIPNPNSAGGSGAASMYA